MVKKFHAKDDDKTCIWVKYDHDQLSKEFDVDLEKGHSEARAAYLLKREGPNALMYQNRILKHLKILLRQIMEATQIVLLLTGILHFLTKQYFAGCLLLSLSLLNFYATYSQELGFDDIVKKMKSGAPAYALVLRDGISKKIDAKNIVLGDVILLNTGDLIPADVRLIESMELKCSEAILTGETREVRKIATKIDDENLWLTDRRNMVFTSTEVVCGRGKGVVVAVGGDTQLGRIFKKINTIKSRLYTKSDQAILRIYVVLIVFAFGFAFFIIALNNFKLNPNITSFALTAIIAPLPSGLRTILLVLMLASGSVLIKENVIIKRKQIFELFAYADTIFCDKTGTITMSKMTVVVFGSVDSGLIVVSGNGYNVDGSLFRKRNTENLRFSINHPEHDEDLEKIDSIDKLSTNEQFVVLCSALCNTAYIQNNTSLNVRGKKTTEWKGFGSPTEISLCFFTHKISYNKDVLENIGWKVIKEIPFDSYSKIMSVIAKSPHGKYYVLSKGSPEKILSLAYGDKNSREYLDICERISQLSKLALRTLAFSFKVLNEDDVSFLLDANDATNEILYDDSVFLGFVGIHDPLRPNVPETISTLREANITARLITGDSRDTAVEIAKEARIIPEDTPEDKLDALVLSGQYMADLTDSQLASLYPRPLVVYRCTPDVKLRIVSNMKDPYYRTAMVGDGLNDAASIKEADIGISMGITATEITRAAADVILINDEFDKIIHLVKESRIIAWRLRYFLIYYLITVFSTFIIVLISFFNKIPNKNQWMLIITGPSVILSYFIGTVSCAWFFSGDPPLSLMEKPPICEKKRLLSNEDICDIIYECVVYTLCTVSPFFLIHRVAGNAELISECDDNLMPECSFLYRARSVTMFIFLILLLITAVNCRSPRRSEWNLEGLKLTLSNRYILCIGIVISIFCICSIYINKLAFLFLRQSSISWETPFIPLFLCLDVGMMELYKYFKRKYLGPYSEQSPPIYSRKIQIK